MQRHDLQQKCSVHCYHPCDEQSFCLFSNLFEGQQAFRAAGWQPQLKRLQMENRVETAAGVLRIPITQEKKYHFECLLFSLREGTSRGFWFFIFGFVFALTWCYLRNHFLLLIPQPTQWTHSQPRCWIREISIAIKTHLMVVDDLIALTLLIRKHEPRKPTCFNVFGGTERICSLLEASARQHHELSQIRNYSVKLLSRWHKIHQRWSRKRELNSATLIKVHFLPWVRKISVQAGGGFGKPS